jgi:hypothetical protein
VLARTVVSAAVRAASCPQLHATGLSCHTTRKISAHKGTARDDGGPGWGAATEEEGGKRGCHQKRKRVEPLQCKPREPPTAAVSGGQPKNGGRCTHMPGWDARYACMHNTPRPTAKPMEYNYVAPTHHRLGVPASTSKIKSQRLEMASRWAHTFDPDVGSSRCGAHMRGASRPCLLHVSQYVVAPGPPPCLPLNWLA